jgi:hypothetical protein
MMTLRMMRMALALATEATAPSQRQATCVMAINLEEARDKAITPMNQLLEDRRPEFYRSIVDA